MGDVKPLRWHGDPSEPEQPDTGDVIVEDHGKRIYLVRHARQVTRGPEAGKPHELRLLVEAGHVGHAWGSDEERAKLGTAAATVFEAHRCRRGCDCRSR